MSMSSEARMATNLPRRYLTQLCKHFEHRLEVSYAEDDGRITFPAGICTLKAEPEALVMRVEAADEEALHQVEGVVARHLERFAFREPPVINWQAVTTG
jgi:uncharacterized protein